MIDYIYSEIKTFLDQFKETTKESSIELEKFLGNPLLNYFQSNNIAFLLFDRAKSDVIYNSKNISEVMGLKPNEQNIFKVLNIFENIHPDHKILFKVLPDLVKNYEESISPENRVTIKRQYWGLKMKHYVKREVRLGIVSFVLEHESNQDGNVTFAVIQDISHLMKGNQFWIRFFNEAEPDKIMTYNFEANTTTNEDILSKRELEVLKLIMEGYDADAIAQKLFISKITVNNHRQNMLNRIGARDTTALITIAKICKF